MMTIADLHNLVNSTSLVHAEFVLGQEETQHGSEAMSPLWEALWKLQLDAQYAALTCTP